MRFLLLASFWARWSFIRAAPTDDLFALGPDEPDSNLNVQSFGDGSDSWDLSFNSGLDQSSNYLPDDSMFGSTNLASSITDASGADLNAFTSSNDFFGPQDSTDLIALQGSCGGTDSSVPSDMLTARDTRGACSAGGNQNPLNWQVPSLFQDPEDTLKGAAQPQDEQSTTPKPKDPDEGKSITQLLIEDAKRFFQGIGGDGIDCTPDVPSRCCTYSATPSGLLDTPLLAVLMGCLPSTLPPPSSLSSCRQPKNPLVNFGTSFSLPSTFCFSPFMKIYLTTDCYARSWCQGPVRGHV